MSFSTSCTIITARGVLRVSPGAHIWGKVGLAAATRQVITAATATTVTTSAATYSAADFQDVTSLASGVPQFADDLDWCLDPIGPWTLT